jgi:hypothetical protein
MDGEISKGPCFKGFEGFSEVRLNTLETALPNRTGNYPNQTNVPRKEPETNKIATCRQMAFFAPARTR